MKPKWGRLGTAVLSLSALLLLTSAAPGADEKGSETAKQAAEALKGQWIMTKATVNGAPYSRQAGRVRYFFDGSSAFIISNDYAVTVEGEFSVNPAKSPRTIDLISEVGSAQPQNHLYGIYEIEGDTLKLCLSMNDRRRPSQFESKRGSGNSYYVFKRVKD